MSISQTHFASGGFAPWTPQQGSALAPRWGPGRPPDPSLMRGAYGPQCRLLSQFLHLLQILLTTLQVSLFSLCYQTAQRQRKQYGGWERMGSLAFPQGGWMFFEELDSLLCLQLVENMKELPWNSMAFLHSYT